MSAAQKPTRRRNADELSELKAQREFLKKELAEIATKFHAKRHECEKVDKELNSKSRELSEVEANHQRRSQSLDADFAAKRKQREQEANEHEAALKRHYGERERAIRQELDTIEQELTAARKQRDREHDKIQAQTDDLHDYVKDRVAPLRRLELITDAQWDALFPNDSDTADPEHSDWPKFDEDVSGAITHIQRYLFGRGIGYLWDLLANFHALLGTGDLIILSGLSGSGKTNLVKSYAEATGNVAKVIPVKPNWTSAEDLIGFYNPLQRNYTSTPFLEALFEARRDPERLHILCLDEMNLARVEYYFADFLSRLEERKEPTIDLYPDDEAGQVLSELRLLVHTLEGLELEPSVSLQHLVSDGPTMAQLAERLGLADGESFPQLHARLRRMLAGALKVPSRLPIPDNVRFVGAVNMDDTTHYLSPKVLDRAHVLQFRSPLHDWQRVQNEVAGNEFPQQGLRIPASAYPTRSEYPAYDPEDPLVKELQDYTGRFLEPLGIDIGMRPLRQAMLYQNQLAKLFEGDELRLLALNNLFRQKLLPRFSFDGKQRARGLGEQTCADVVNALRGQLARDLRDNERFNAKRELDQLVARAETNDGNFNYWA